MRKAGLCGLLFLAACTTAPVGESVPEAALEACQPYVEQHNAARTVGEDMAASAATGAAMGGVMEAAGTSVVEILGFSASVPFPIGPAIMAGALTIHGVKSGLMRAQEAREAILAACLRDRGYTVYGWE